MDLIPFQPATRVKTLAAILLVVLVWQPFEIWFALAQETMTITPTKGVGDLGTTVTADGNAMRITGGTRPGNGVNLFHSFDQFSIGPADTAHFLNTTPSLQTDNILSRVTGGSPSGIFGIIDTASYPGANLFLMNPAGIVFGPNATLNVGGSVAFTTADYLRLAGANGSNAGIFRADTITTSLLTSAPVAAFGFLGTNPAAAIAVQESELEMKLGHSISLVGGNQGFDLETGAFAPNGVTMTGAKLMVQSGRVNIASVASSGEIIAETLAFAPNGSSQSPGALGIIQISEQSTIESGEGGGTVLIRGGRLIVDSSTISSNTGDIFIDTTSIDITGTQGPTGIQTQIVTGTESAANAGHIILNASSNIEIGSNVLIWSASGGSEGNAGNITVRSSQGNINFTNEASVTSQAFDGNGSSGSIEIDAQHGDILFSNSSAFTSVIGSTGAIGGIRISANNLRLLKESRIDGDNFSTQAARNMEIFLTNSLSLAGSSEIETGATGRADAAGLIIRARDISITDGSSLSADTTNSSSGAGGTISIRNLSGPTASVTVDGPGSGIFTDTKGLGPGGTIDLSTRSLTLQNGGTISASTTGAHTRAVGGSIIINATDQVTLTNGASITASSIVKPETPNTGIANAGNIFINAGQQLEVLDDSSITTQAARASGGNIDIRAIDRIRFVNSTVSTSVLAEDGKGGNIFIDPNVVILEGSEVAAKAVGGAGGNITFVTPLFLADSVSLGLLSAKSESGLNGTVLIQSPTSNLSGAVGQLVSKTSPPQVLLQNRCVALAGGEQSTFLLAGRDALPSEPGGWLSSPVAMEHWTGEVPEDHVSRLMVRSRGWNTQPLLVMSKDQTTVLSLRRLTPPGFLVRSFAASAPTGCSS